MEKHIFWGLSQAWFATGRPGFSDMVLTQFTKMAATSLSSNTLGQAEISKPQKYGDPTSKNAEKWGI